MPRVLTVDPIRPDPDAIREAALELDAGGLVAFPTETVYGLGADAFDAEAVGRVFDAKGRPADDPVIVHVLGLDGLQLASPSASDLALELANAFWPGPLTLVVPRGPNVPKVVTAGLDSVGVRAPAHPVARALLEAFGRPIAAPSANLFGMTSPTTAAHVQSSLADRVGLVLDAGPTQVGVESTVVDCRRDPPTVLRPGGVTLEQLDPWGTALASGGPTDPDWPSEPGTAHPSPGQMARHYAPRALMVLVRPALEGALPARVAPTDSDAPAAGCAPTESVSPTVGVAPNGCDAPTRSDATVRRALAAAADRLLDRGLKVGILAATEDEEALAALPAGVRVILVGSLRAPEEAARGLFAAVHELDEAGVDVILARGFGRAGLALAIDDRLARAAEGRVLVVSPDPTDDNEEAAASAAAAISRMVESASGGPLDRPS